MRFRHPDGSVVHLAYCTNVHAAEQLDGVLRQLTEYAEPVRRRLHRDRLGIGLWLARDAARTLTDDPAAVRRLRAGLERAGLEVVTLNGFPYQGFGDEHVKYRVYRPDWTDDARLDHTTDLARLLAALLPDDVREGSISTLPLAWRTGFDAEARHRALSRLHTLAARLDALEELTGRTIRVGLEPEPGCTVETTADAVAALAGDDAPPAHRIGVCVDTCHLATAFEDPAEAVARLTGAGLSVVKTQLSAALHAEHPERPEVRAALAEFAEPRFLHQTRALTPTGALRATDDLDRALAPGALPVTGPWRSHFHVPLHAPLSPPLTATTPVLRRTLEQLVGGPAPLTRHLEVETYTWQALPTALRPTTRAQLADGLAAELSTARDLLVDLGLKELP
ncbi:metabolite traffic protein EboE [Streptomyces albus]|uniref:metabolite traffic protein EboE n=1 Tax=Streptomyces TaxID=1883 RepID=UPI0004BD4752|nr:MULTISPECIES: metabolite traffic protein EboE [Streptomyces]KPC95264.1 xylose isomerase [Streptomyces sp. NRRL F-6602]QID38935.1 metabolite traffic protein EboE [Streptomyces albus]